MFQIEIKSYGLSDFNKLDTVLVTKQKGIRFANVIFNKSENQEVRIVDLMTRKVVWHRAKSKNENT